MGPEPPDEPASSGAISRRFAVVVNCLGLVAAYAIEVPMKWYGLTPAGVSWLDALLGPILIFGLLATALILPRFFPNRGTLCVLGPTAVFMVVVLTLVALERGW